MHHPTTGNQPTWQVAGRDFAGRQRSAIVTVSGTGCVVRVPAGESVVFTRAELLQFRAVLAEADGEMRGHPGERAAD